MREVCAIASSTTRPLTRHGGMHAARRGTMRTRVSSATTEIADVKLVGPEPRRFEVAEGQLQNIASAGFAALIRGGCGALCAGYKVTLERETEANKGQYSVLSLPLGFRVKETSKVGTFARPETPLTFYDKQDCPASRKVREVFSILDLDVLTLPCPEGGATFAPELAQRSPGAKAPFLVDANTGFELADADEIVSYLFCTYGNRQIPLALRPGKLSELTATVGLAPRKGAGGTKAGATRQPALPLEFWAYEASPFCVIVKEVLAELEIPHVQRSCARGSPKRQQLLDGPAGHFQVPYLVDPNAGVAMFESSAIIEYLRTTYGA